MEEIRVRLKTRKREIIVAPVLQVAHEEIGRNYATKIERVREKEKKVEENKGRKKAASKRKLKGSVGSNRIERRS